VIRRIQLSAVFAVVLILLLSRDAHAETSPTFEQTFEFLQNNLPGSTLWISYNWSLYISKITDYRKTKEGRCRGLNAERNPSSSIPYVLVKYVEANVEVTDELGGGRKTAQRTNISITCTQSKCVQVQSGGPGTRGEFNTATLEVGNTPLVNSLLKALVHYKSLCGTKPPLF
jgi:hypothetical protein